MKKILILALALCLMLCACNKTPATTPDPQTQTPEGGDVTAKTDATVTLPKAAAPKLKTISSYDDVYKELTSYRNEAGAYASGNWRGMDEMAVAEETAESPAAADSAYSTNGVKSESMEMEANGSGDYSETNVQTEGVDEADIIKTDGKYIYYFSGGVLKILSPNGTQVDVISEVQVNDEQVNDENEDDDGYEYMYYDNMYLAGDKIVLIGQYYHWYNDNGTDCVNAVIYDVSDPANPVKADTIGQSGCINTTRLVGDVLYIVSNEYVYDCKEDEPTTFIPCMYRNGEANILPIDDICIPEECRGTQWMTVAAYDVTTAEKISAKTMLCAADTVYMSRDNIYIADVSYVSDESEPYTEDQYKVTEYTNYSKIDIYKFSYDAGQIEFDASGAVNGTLMDQFSLDEYDGNLRVVTTSNYYSYKDYYDEKHDFHNYESTSDSMNNGLYVLDGDMNVIGTVDKLAEDERVYSCRFIGDVGYFVTFRQTDPLFAVDVSDPANPKVLSELKITGFSEYLHGWKDGKLLGIGMEADEEGRTDTMKLSMFDVSDPTNVTEEDKLILPYYYSEALYNHHAIFVDVERGLIGFSAYGEDGTDYVVYSYGDNGFGEYAKQTDTEYSWNMRGVRIGNYLYVVDSENINVIEL